MFKCKVCTEKDKLISELTKQVEFMKAMAFPSHVSNSQAFMQSLEANKILSGETDQITISNKMDDVEDASSDFYTHWM